MRRLVRRANLWESRPRRDDRYGLPEWTECLDVGRLPCLVEIAAVLATHKVGVQSDHRSAVDSKGCEFQTKSWGPESPLIGAQMSAVSASPNLYKAPRDAIEASGVQMDIRGIQHAEARYSVL